jgi:hypothetical protein
MEAVDRHATINNHTAQMFKVKFGVYGYTLVLDGGRAYVPVVAARRFPRVRAAHGAVLIIAEDPVAREVYGELFAMRGYEVITASGARDGLRCARDKRVTTAVVALSAGGPQLRKQLHTLRPTLRVHVTGLLPLPFDVMAPLARQQLH